MRGGALLLLAACGGGGGGGTDPPPRPATPPALESVPFDDLGGGRLAFRRTSSEGAYLYVIDVGARAVTALGMYALSADPALSPDGGRIAYVAWSSSGLDSETLFDVSIKGITGADSVRLSALDGQESSPSWSPDGQYVYFWTSALPSGLYRRQVGASAPPPALVLADFVDEQTCASPSPASISADGRLALACWLGAIHAARADGSDPRVLVPYAPAPGRRQQFHAPTWSPDARWIAFVEEVFDPVAPTIRVEQSVRIARADGSESRVVVAMTTPIMAGTLGHNHLSLAWSPDGSRLAFNVTVGPAASHVYVVRVDGTGLRQVTTRTGAHDHSISWVP